MAQLSVLPFLDFHYVPLSPPSHPSIRFPQTAAYLLVFKGLLKRYVDYILKPPFTASDVEPARVAHVNECPSQVFVFYTSLTDCWLAYPAVA
jgi:hypothetical protein